MQACPKLWIPRIITYSSYGLVIALAMEWQHEAASLHFLQSRASLTTLPDGPDSILGGWVQRHKQTGRTTMDQSLKADQSLA